MARVAISEQLSTYHQWLMDVLSKDNRSFINRVIGRLLAAVNDNNEREDCIREHAYLMWLDEGKPDGAAGER